MAVVKYWFRNAAERLLDMVPGTLSLLLLLIGSALATSSVASGTTTDSSSSERAPVSHDAELLQTRLQALSSYSARFTQEIIGARGQTLEQSTGRVVMRRPAFRWQVDDPYPQIIVADEALVKIYDPDLEQLTIRPMDEALQDTPISLLSKDAVSLSDRFSISRVDDADGESFIVTPLSEETLYAEIRLRFNDSGLADLGILDHLGQYTRIRFQPDPESAVIQSSDFQLEVPPGTDVIGG